MAVYTLDTSAVLAYIRGENGEDEVETLLKQARDDASIQLLVPFMVLMEVEHISLREMNEGEVEEDLAEILSWPIRVMESNEDWRRKAASVRAGARLSLADAWVASLALVHDAKLVHKDPEFESVDGLKMLKLPYDRDSQRSGT